MAISASDANATRVAVAAFIVTPDDHWRYVALRSDAASVRSDDAVAPCVGMGGCPGQDNQGDKQRGHGCLFG